MGRKKKTAKNEIRSNREQSETKTPGSASHRRYFLKKIWLGLGVIALIEVGAVVLSFLRPRKPQAHVRAPSGLIVAGSIDDFQPGTVTAFKEGHFYLARLEDGGLLALSRRCTHLGCTVQWQAARGRFLCPCHASAFDIKGVVVKAPAPRPLDILKVTIENKIVTVDAAHPIKRRDFSPENIAYI